MSTRSHSRSIEEVVGTAHYSLDDCNHTQAAHNAIVDDDTIMTWQLHHDTQKQTAY